MCLTAEIGRQRAAEMVFLMLGFWCLNINTAGIGLIELFQPLITLPLALLLRLHR